MYELYLAVGNTETGSRLDVAGRAAGQQFANLLLDNLLEPSCAHCNELQERGLYSHFPFPCFVLHVCPPHLPLSLPSCP